MEFDPTRVVFLGHGQSAVCYYRCMLPAMQMGADWVAVLGEPPKLHVPSGLVRDRKTGQPVSRVPDLLSDDYDIVVMQQPFGGNWVKLIDTLRDRGKVVLYEIDDYLHGIKSEKDHLYREHFTRTFLSDVEWAMKHCDGIICSTEYIASQYRHFNKKVYVCPNGIDTRRYDLTRPKRSAVNIGWAGATGHLAAIEPWLPAVGQIMRMREEVNFVSIGRTDFADGFAKVFGEHRAIGTPWAAIEQYPGAMTMMDIALAPARASNWWRGKSDLRWLEASALGIPVVADPQNYGEIEDEETGFLAESPQHVFEILVRLVSDRKLRRGVGAQASAHVRENRSMKAMVENWTRTFTEILDAR